MHVHITYTGGTIGMVDSPHGLVPGADLEGWLDSLLKGTPLARSVSVTSLAPLIDSSNATPLSWQAIVDDLRAHAAADPRTAFVILHGTDTMAYTASALSFLLEDLSKPVIITGSQLPIGQLRTDGKENLLTSIEIAAAKTPDGTPIVPEVCIYFDSRLMRGNRTTKINAEGFNAFRSFNYPSLAHAGINIKYEPHLILQRDFSRPLKPHYLMDDHVMILTIFPGIRKEFVEHFLSVPNLRGVVLKTFGAGNAPQKPWLIDCLKKLDDQGVVLANITQCSEGRVEMHRYETGLQLLQVGVINGYDSTPESMLTKLMFLLGHNYDRDTIHKLMNTSLCGEISI